MAIFHLSTHTMSRSAGHSAVAAAAYRSAEKLVDMRTGEVFDYTRKAGVLSREIVVPQGMQAPEREALWNAVEAAEKRKDARTAREWLVALPHELSDEARQQLAKQMGKLLADRYGVAVDVCIHAPDKQGDDRNYHAHLLATTRILQADGSLGAKASIELANKDRARLGIAGTTQNDIQELRREWAELSNQALSRSGIVESIDHRSYADQGVSLTPTKHIGPHGMSMERRGLSSDRGELNQADLAKQIAEIEARPEIILDKVTATKAVFNRRDVAAELARYIDDKDQFQRLLVKLENSPSLVELEPASGRDPARYSTREMIATERNMADAAERLARSGKHGASTASMNAAIAGVSSISAEQARAVRHVCQAGSLAVIIGDAGTGKSFSMRVAREVWEAQGFKVRGAALAGKAADELQAGSGIASRTLASLELAWKNGKDKLTNRDVLVIDEAGMVGSRQLGRVLAAAEKAGAKVVLLGDDKQLAAIEAGAALRAVVQHVGASEITEVRRQRHAWAREAGQALARGSVSEGLQAYAERGHVRMSESRKEARDALAKAYVEDGNTSSQIILAHANADVLALNEAVRDARKAKGELSGMARFMTERGGREFSAGDRIVFLRNDSQLGVKNGTLGTVQHAQNGRLEVRLDSGEARNLDAEQYKSLDYGYAVTIHKAQGVTVDRAYLLATPGMDRSLTYVGMTRHREAATLFAAKEDFTDKRAGILLSHGSAPYENDPNNSLSYFAKLQSASGEIQTLWGVDLQRALTESGAKIGAQATFERTGSETLQLSDGRTAERNLWRVNSGEDLSMAMLTKSLSRERVKESTLDFANRREMDGESILRRWIDQGRAKIEQLAARARKAMDYAKEKFQSQAAQSAIDKNHQAAEQAKPTKSAVERAAEQLKARAQTLANAKQPETLDEVIAQAREKLEAVYTQQGKNPRHHSAEISEKAQADAMEWVRAKSPPERVSGVAKSTPEQDAAALEGAITQRTSERSGRAARVTAALERLCERTNAAIRQHQQIQPAAPGGLAAMFGGKAKFETALSSWQQRAKQLNQRASELHRRLRTVSKIAQSPLDARRLATTKIKREQPELTLRVAAEREYQRQAQQKQNREQMQQKLQQQRDQGRGPGRGR